MGAPLCQAAVEWKFDEMRPRTSAAARAKEDFRAMIDDDRIKLAYKEWELWRIQAGPTLGEKPGTANAAPKNYWVLLNTAGQNYFIWQQGEFNDWAKGFLVTQQTAEPFRASALPSGHRSRTKKSNEFVTTRWALGPKLSSMQLQSKQLHRQMKSCSDVRELRLSGGTYSWVCLTPSTAKQQVFLTEGIHILSVVGWSPALQRLSNTQRNLPHHLVMTKMIDRTDWKKESGWETAVKSAAWKSGDEWRLRLKELRAEKSKWRSHPWNANGLEVL
jgi:hypothetical protein